MVTEAKPFFERIRIAGNPAADPGSVVVAGMARFTVLTNRLIRMEWAQNAQFEDHATFAFPNRKAETPTFTRAGDESALIIKTDALTLHYQKDGLPFHAGNLSITLNVDGKSVSWTPGMTNPGNLRGTRRTLDQCADSASLDEGLLSRDGWSLFDDSGAALWDSAQTWMEARPDEHVYDWYFFGYGQDYKALLRDYVQFGGAIPLVPRYVLGNWWSRFWAYHADDLIQLVNDFEAHEIPLDVLVVDMDWHTPVAWTGYTWNRDLFPEPEAFLASVHQRDLFVTFNLHPAQGVQKHEAMYTEFAQLMGQNPATGEAVHFNSTNKTFVENYFKLLHHPMEEQGVDFWWVDWQQGEASNVKNLDPLPWLNHLHFRDSTRRGARPMLYSRWGGLGNHRYPIGFSGDAYTTWESLAFQPYFTATAANVCYGWWSHDIGGHFGAADPELYARWVQFGAVSPCLRLHSTKDPLAERRPWGFPEPIYHAAKAGMQLRYRLFPYLYSASRAASQQGLSLCCPMYYDYPASEDAYLARGQYFLGDQLIAAPIITPTDPETGLAAFDVWIPEGTWFEFTTHETFTGPRWVQLQGDLNRIPLFAKAGAIVPIAGNIMRTHAFDGSHVILTVFPGADGHFELYEDDGVTEAYQRGEYQTTVITLTSPDAQTTTISIAPAQGNYADSSAKRTFELHVRGLNQPSAVKVNQSEHGDWAYDAAAREVVIHVTDVERTAALEVTVQAQSAAQSQPTSAPFVHVIDYTSFEDARQHLGAVVIAAPADASVFDAEIEWHLVKDSVKVSAPSVSLKNCTSEQILYSPFKDEGDFSTFRWNVSVTLLWNGQRIPFAYESADAYPSVTRWQALIYNPEQQPQTLSDVLAADGSPNTALDWFEVNQTVENSLNIKQPYGAILLENERQRIMDGESLEACVTTSLTSRSVQEAVLYVQSAGDARLYLNGEELHPVEPLQHAPFSPMFFSWIIPTHSYYALPLQAGNNQLVVFTRPTDKVTGWWGLGAMVFDTSGKVLAATERAVPVS